MIYENIRNLREDHDKTQKELADYLNINHIFQIRAWENQYSC